MKIILAIAAAVTVLGLAARAYLPETWKQGTDEIEKLQSGGNSTDETPTLPGTPTSRDLRNNKPMDVEEPVEAGDPLPIDKYMDSPWPKF